jgi:cytoskeleton protein RodZ
MARKPKTSQEELMKQVETVTPANPVQMAMTDDAAYRRSRCGGALRQARETQGLSVQDVASKLRLGPKQIEAIEADHFEKLPEPTIVRGFIRNYAKLLKINAEPLLDAYIVIVPSNARHEMTVKPSTNMQMTSGDKRKMSSYLGAGLLALLALGIWLFYLNYIQKPSPTKPSASAEILTTEALPEPALPAAERAPQQASPSQSSIELTLPPATDTAVPPPAATAPAGTANPAAVVPNPGQVTAPVVSLPAEPVPPPAPTGMSKLEFNASQETWINVTDASGREIYNKTIFAGSRESIDVTPPVNVTVGNAGATSLNMNGKTINLAPHSRNNVAHIKLE